MGKFCKMAEGLKNLGKENPYATGGKQGTVQTPKQRRSSYFPQKTERGMGKAKKAALIVTLTIPIIIPYAQIKINKLAQSPINQSTQSGILIETRDISIENNQYRAEFYESPSYVLVELYDQNNPTNLMGVARDDGKDCEIDELVLILDGKEVRGTTGQRIEELEAPIERELADILSKNP